MFNAHPNSRETIIGTNSRMIFYPLSELYASYTRRGLIFRPEFALKIRAEAVIARLLSRLVFSARADRVYTHGGSLLLRLTQMRREQTNGEYKSRVK